MRQHPVQNDEIPLAVDEAGEAVTAVMDRNDRKPVFLKVKRHDLGKVMIVFDQQDSGEPFLFIAQLPYQYVTESHAIITAGPGDSKLSSALVRYKSGDGGSRAAGAAINEKNHGS